MIHNLELASRALQAFSEFAEMIENYDTDPGGQNKRYPALHMYSDGSGRVHDAARGVVYFTFRDLGQLLDQCIERLNQGDMLHGKRVS